MNERERQRKIDDEAPTTAAYLFLSRRRKAIDLCIGYVYRGASKSHRPPAMADLFAKKVTGSPSRKRARILNVAIRVHHHTKRSERRQIKATPRTLLLSK